MVSYWYAHSCNPHPCSKHSQATAIKSKSKQLENSHQDDLHQIEFEASSNANNGFGHEDRKIDIISKLNQMFEELEADYDRAQMKNFPDLEIVKNENNEEDSKIISEHMKFDSKEGVIQRKVRIIYLKVIFLSWFYNSHPYLMKHSIVKIINSYT